MVKIRVLALDSWPLLRFCLKSVGVGSGLGCRFVWIWWFRYEILYFLVAFGIGLRGLEIAKFWGFPGFKNRFGQGRSSISGNFDTETPFKFSDGNWKL